MMPDTLNRLAAHGRRGRPLAVARTRIELLCSVNESCRLDAVKRDPDC